MKLIIICILLVILICLKYVPCAQIFFNLNVLSNKILYSVVRLKCDKMESEVGRCLINMVRILIL